MQALTRRGPTKLLKVLASVAQIVVPKKRSDIKMKTGRLPMNIAIGVQRKFYKIRLQMNNCITPTPKVKASQLMRPVVVSFKSVVSGNPQGNSFQGPACEKCIENDVKE